MEWRFGRKEHHIYRPGLLSQDGTSSIPFRPEGSTTFKVDEETRRFWEKGFDSWELVPFTGKLLWYVGMGIDLVGTFENGVLKEVKNYEDQH
jgi:hypothetical protein